MKGLLFAGALVCLAAVLFPAGVQARRPVEISGRVVDTMRRPLSGVLISVPALNESALSDERGRYRMTIGSRVRRGQRVVIQASRDGFDRASRPVDLFPRGRLRVDFRLAPLE